MVKQKNKTTKENNNENLNTDIINENDKELHDLREQNTQLINQLNLYNNNNNVIDDTQTKWTNEREELSLDWLDLLKYHHLIYYFYVFKLKKIEGFWSWTLIVLSAVATTISAFQFHDDYQEVELGAKIAIIFVTFFTTLIAAWIKKQGYIERVAELDKYLLKIKKIIEHLEADLKLPWNVRMEFDEFIKKYKDIIITFNHTAPLISPDDWKETVYMITLYYPEKALEIYPWNTYPLFSENIIENYSFVKYNTFCKKFWSCFYCQSKCCGKTKTNKEFRKYTKNLYTDNILYNEENVSPRKKRLNRNSDKFYYNVNDYDLESNQPISNQKSENNIDDMEKENLLSPKMVSLMDPQIKLDLPEDVNTRALSTSSNNLNLSIQSPNNKYNSLVPSSPVSSKRSGKTSECII